MKKLLSVVLVAMLSTALFGCKHKNEGNKNADAAKAVVQTPAPVAPVVQPAVPATAPVAPVAQPPAPAAAPEIKEGEVKKVCVDINGTKKCKNVKMHKKFEGTAIPPKK